MIDIVPELESTAQKFQFEIKSIIESSVPPPNAPSTIAKKGHDHTLIDKGNYLKSIDYEVTEHGFVVAPNDPKIAIIATYNEHGTAHIPPRPVWGPVADGVGERILDELEQDILDKFVLVLKGGK
jgi:hypothetical protein